MLTTVLNQPCILTIFSHYLQSNFAFHLKALPPLLSVSSELRLMYTWELELLWLLLLSNPRLLKRDASRLRMKKCVNAYTNKHTRVFGYA